MPGGMPDGMPDGIPDGIPDEIPGGIPDEASRLLPVDVYPSVARYAAAPAALVAFLSVNSIPRV